ncbi:MAG: dihydroorotase [Victivallales bacterium]|nr:dihydroorotase [Victivallales bacterium]
MTKQTTFILAGGRVVDPSRNLDRVMDIGVADGMIVDPNTLSGAERVDVSGLVVVPGLIDIHVHLRDPGQTISETISTGAMAAAAGGFTSIVPMPNTRPAADNTGTIDHIMRKARSSAVVKLLPCGALTKGLEGQEMAPIGGLKKAGVYALSDDGRCVQNNYLMRNIVRYAKAFDLPILDHCEEVSMVNKGVMHEGEWSTLLGIRGIPSAAEEIIVARDIIFARDEECRIHIQHISAREAVEKVRAARKEGISITAEATPHHITFTDEQIKHFDTNFKMNPPLRSEDDREALLEGLRDGTITVIATDHAPHNETSKLVEFDHAPFGIVGLETAVSVCLTQLYHRRILTLSQLIAKFTVGPAEVLGLDIGTLREGVPADITLIDINESYTIDKNDFFSKSRNTPFHGMKVKGRVKATICDGKFVYDCRCRCRSVIGFPAAATALPIAGSWGCGFRGRRLRVRRR